MTEKVFIAQLKNPKTKEFAYKKLISDYKERLYWHIRKIVKTHSDTDDILQNTFIKFFRNIDKFNEKSKLYSWIYRIATNEAITFLNKRAKMLHITIEDVNYSLAQNLECDVFYDGNEIQLKLQLAIAKLPQKQQLVFNMKYFDEMKYSEMSKILDTSVGALKASYHHATKKIKAFLVLTD